MPHDPPRIDMHLCDHTPFTTIITCATVGCRMTFCQMALCATAGEDTAIDLPQCSWEDVDPPSPYHSSVASCPVLHRRSPRYTETVRASIPEPPLPIPKTQRPSSLAPFSFLQLHFSSHLAILAPDLETPRLLQHRKCCLRRMWDDVPSVTRPCSLSFCVTALFLNSCAASFHLYTSPIQSLQSLTSPFPWTHRFCLVKLCRQLSGEYKIQKLYYTNLSS